MEVSIIPVLLCDHGGIWVIKNIEVTAIIMLMIAPVLSNTDLLPERVSFWFTWLFIKLFYFPYCCKNNAINQPGNKADYHQDLICSGPRLCDCNIYKVNCQRAEQHYFY